MIVASHEKGWKIAYQRSHGLLAAMLANQYDIDLPNEIIVPTMIAIAEHDDGLYETMHDNNLTVAGAPKSFELIEFDLEQNRSVMEIASSKSELNALLTSMHLDFLYAERALEIKELGDFIKGQKKYRKQLLKSLDMSPEFAERLYRFVEWCDAFSLLICCEKIQPEGRKMDISEGPDGTVHQVYFKNETTIGVEPWPFRSKSFDVFYEYRIVNEVKFSKIEELNEALSKTSVLVQRYTVSS